MKEWLRHEWLKLASNYSEDTSETEGFWSEIEHQYSLKIRHYHNLSHIQNMLSQAKEIKECIEDYDTFRFAIWYHDIIYKPTRNDNEEKSADLAEKRLKSFKIEEKRIEIVKNLIISTKKHELILNENEDNAYVLDIDLSILGYDRKTYEKYIQDIRKEYAIYPNFMYKKGRKKVLQHFINRETLFFTENYKSRFEHQARKNLKKENESL